MTEPSAIVALPNRAVLTVEGEDRRTFLQGLVSNDVMRVSPEHVVWAALLTAQGKFLHEFFVAEIGDGLLIEGEAARLADLKRRLSLYKLRAKVTIGEAPELEVFAAWGDGVFEHLALSEVPGSAAPFAGGLVFTDPRLAEMGVRLWLPKGVAPPAFRPAELAAWDRHRIALGVPDGSRDIEIEKGTLLESGFEELNGVDFAKGCYIGQELTARTKYRALLKKRLVPFRVEGPLPPPGTLIEGDAGEIRSGADDMALGLVRLEALGSPLQAAGARLTPAKPEWASF
jgi:folate-binding protein YgfZ